MSIPNTPAWWRNSSRSQLKLTLAVNVARINLSTRQRPPWQHSPEKNESCHSCKVLIYRSQDGRRERGKDESKERLRLGGWEGQKEGSESPGFWLPLVLHQSFPFKRQIKIMPYGYDRMQMRSRRENTLIAAESQNPDEKLCSVSAPGAPPPAQRLSLHATPELQASRASSFRPPWGAF